MPINTEDAIELVTILGEEENIKIAVKSSVAGGLIAGGATAVGGMILGPVGLAIGGTVGGLIAMAAYNNKFMSVGEAIASMRRRDKERLANCVRSIMTNIDATDVVHLMAIISGNQVLRREIILLMKNYLTNEMGLSILN